MPLTTAITLGEKCLNVALWDFTETGSLDPLLFHPSHPGKLGSVSPDAHPNWGSWHMSARGIAYAFARKGSSYISRKGKIYLETVFLNKHC